jgi:nucleoside-diphosphate-sugar epimerase|tara:strand:+ start:236 stop:1177 length:942 start_codon:yes stop_codon:yes gene_type:complete
MKNKKTFLITGGTGFIGYSICNLLLELGYKVIVLDNNSRGNSNKLARLSKKVKFIKGDIRDKSKVFKSLKNVNAVIHLAYINGTKYFYEKPELILDVAVKGLINIFDGCKKFKIKELYLASSSEVYQTPLKVPTREDEPLKIPDINNPRYSYGGGKILTELMGINYGKKFFKRLIIFRPHNVYGADMGDEHVIPEIILKMKKLKKSKNLKIQGSGNEIRSFIYIKDFVKAFSCILKKGKHMQVYNIGTSKSIKIKELVLKISKIMKKKIVIKTTPLRKGGTKIRMPDITKIKKLGFKPKYSLDQGLKEIILKT